MLNRPRFVYALAGEKPDNGFRTFHFRRKKKIYRNISPKKIGEILFEKSVDICSKKWNIWQKVEGYAASLDIDGASTRHD